MKKKYINEINEHLILSDVVNIKQKYTHTHTQQAQ